MPCFRTNVTTNALGFAVSDHTDHRLVVPTSAWSGLWCIVVMRYSQTKYRVHTLKILSSMHVSCLSDGRTDGQTDGRPGRPQMIPSRLGASTVLRHATCTTGSPTCSRSYRGSYRDSWPRCQGLIKSRLSRLSLCTHVPVNAEERGNEKRRKKKARGYFRPSDKGERERERSVENRSPRAPYV